jgi:hypothetical protein
LALIISAGYLIVYKTMGLIAEQDFWGILKALLLSAGLYSAGSYLFVFTIKWLSIGRYRPGSGPCGPPLSGLARPSPSSMKPWRYLPFSSI